MLNYRFVARQFGLLYGVLGGILLVVSGWSGLAVAQGLGGEEHALVGLLISAGVGLAVGGVLWLATRRCKGSMGRREALLLVALSWLGGAVVCALPFFIWAHIGGADDHVFRNPINCYFEAMSGLTTTGATVLSSIEVLPSSILLWRALTHWLGGLGIVVLFVAVLPILGAGGKKLFRVESPGPTPEGVKPLIRETARLLWLIYVLLTVAETIALRLAGMNWFDALCHTFATLATGGFSTLNASVGGFHSVAVDVIVIIFMILAGVNFGIYYQLIRGRARSVWRDTELRVYLAIILVGSMIVVLSLLNAGTPITITDGSVVPATVGNTVRHGVFTAVSVQTTTGFCSADFDLWPFLARGVLIALMFIGGSAGSTGGGLKVIRIIICFKCIVAEIERAFRPNVIRPVKVNKVTIDSELKLGTLAYVLGVIILFFAGAGLVMALEPADHNCNFITAATASVATLFNIGPGLGGVGAVQNYGWFTDASKLVLTLLMTIGRLEVAAIAVLFVPRFWRGD